MAEAEQWDPKSINDTFRYRAKDASRWLEECLTKTKHNPHYQWFADEASAKASVYEYLLNRSFLASRPELIAALNEFRALPAPKLETFDRERFADRRLLEIDSLLKEFGERVRGSWTPRRRGRPNGTR